MSSFFRLFGDSDGDADAHERDREAFRSAFGTTTGAAGCLWYFGFDRGGVVAGHENGQFSRRFGSH